MADFNDDPFADIPDDDPFADMQSAEPTVKAKPPSQPGVRLTEKPGTIRGFTEKYYKTGIQDVGGGIADFIAGALKPRVSPEGDLDTSQTGEQVQNLGRVLSGGIRTAFSAPAGFTAGATVPLVQTGEQFLGDAKGIVSKPLEELIPDIWALLAGPLAKGRARATSRALPGEFPTLPGGKWTREGVELAKEGKRTPDIPITQTGETSNRLLAERQAGMQALDDFLGEQKRVEGAVKESTLDQLRAERDTEEILRAVREENRSPTMNRSVEQPLPRDPTLPTGKRLLDPGEIDAAGQEPWFPRAGGPMPRDIMAEPKAYPKGAMADARLRSQGEEAVRSQARNLLDRDALIAAEAEKARAARLFPPRQEPTRIPPAESRPQTKFPSQGEGPTLDAEFTSTRRPTSGGAQPGDITEMHAGIPVNRQEIKDYIKALPGVQRMIDATATPRAYLIGPQRSPEYLTTTRGAKGASAEVDYRVNEIATGMDRVISKAVKNDSWAHGYTTQEVRVRAALALQGNYNSIPKDSAVGQAFDRAKTIIDRLTELKRERGLISEAAAAIPDYVRRLYARDVLGGDEWARLIPESIKTKGVEYILRNEQIKIGKDYRSVTMEEAKAIADSIIKEGHTGQFSSRIRSPYLIKAGQLKSRKDIPEEIRGLMGEIDDGVYLAARTIHDGSNLVITHDFMKSFAQGSDTIKGVKTEWVSPNPRMGYTRVKFNDYTHRAMGKNAGEDVYILNKYANDFEHAFGGSNVDNATIWDKVFTPLTTMFKTAKTIYNPATHGRNVLGNLVFASGAGNSLLNPGNIRYYATALKEIFQGGNMYMEAIRSSAMGPEFASAELKLIANTYYKSKGDWMSFIKNLSVESVARSLVNNPVGRGLGTAYSFEDRIFKLASFVKQRQLGMSVDEASLHVNKFFTRYDEPTRAIRDLSQTMGGIFGSPFASFAAESIRIGKNMMAERPFTFAAWMLGVPALSYGSKAMLGMTTEEMNREFRRIPPSLRSKLGTYFLPFRDANGNVQFIDTTYWHPLGQFLKGVVDKDLINRPFDIPFVSDFVGGNPIVTMAYEIMSNEQLSPFKKGEPVRRPSEGWEAYTKHFVKTMAPPLLPGGTAARQIGAAATGKPGRFGQSKSVLDALVGEITPFRVTSIDPQLSKFTQGLHKSEVRRVDEDLRWLHDEYKKKKITPTEYRSRLNNILDAQREIRESFYGN